MKEKIKEIIKEIIKDLIEEILEDMPLMMAIGVLMGFQFYFVYIDINKTQVIRAMAIETCHPYKLISKNTVDIIDSLSNKSTTYVVCTSSDGKPELKELK